MPVTVMFPEVPDDPPRIWSVARPFPPGVRLTLEGEIDHVVQNGVGHVGGGVV